MSKTAHIISFNHSSFAVSSMSAALKAMEILSKLQPCGCHYDSDSPYGVRDAHYFPKDETVELSIKMNEPYKPKAKALALPRPRKGAIRCACGHSDVAPGHDCPSCGAPFVSV